MLMSIMTHLCEYFQICAMKAGSNDNLVTMLSTSLPALPVGVQQSTSSNTQSHPSPYLALLTMFLLVNHCPNHTSFLSLSVLQYQFRRSCPEQTYGTSKTQTDAEKEEE